jgi:DNA repair protein RecN (Recombination protein N)
MGAQKSLMLTLLKIRNLALVDELSWELGNGLISVTGETGAGKSVIVGALKLVLGERADKSLIRTGEESCIVEAVFSLHAPEEVRNILSENGLELPEGDDLIIRRIIAQSSTRQFVNDSPVTLGLLKKLGEHLVDLHGPHDHQSLFSRDQQMLVLDSFASAESALMKKRQEIHWISRQCRF